MTSVRRGRLAFPRHSSACLGAGRRRRSECLGPRALGTDSVAVAPADTHVTRFRARPLLPPRPDRHPPPRFVPFGRRLVLRPRRHLAVSCAAFELLPPWRVSLVQIRACRPCWVPPAESRAGDRWLGHLAVANVASVSGTLLVL